MDTCHRKCDQTVADGGQGIVNVLSRRATAALRSSPSLRLRQTTLHLWTDRSQSVSQPEVPRTHEIGQLRTQPVVTETSEPREVQLPTQSPAKDQESGRALSDVAEKADVDVGLTAREASNSAARTGQDPVTDISSEVVVEGGAGDGRSAQRNGRSEARRERSGNDWLGWSGR